MDATAFPRIPHALQEPRLSHMMVGGGEGECPVWRFQNKSVDERTCKHLHAYLGG